MSDTAQAYRNEAEAGKAVRESGLARKDIFITTKYSGSNGLDVETSIANSLENVRQTSFYPLPFWWDHHDLVGMAYTPPLVTAWR